MAEHTLFAEVARSFRAEVCEERLSPWDRLGAATRAFQLAGRDVQRAASTPTDVVEYSWVSHQLIASVAAHRRRDSVALQRLLSRIPEHRALFLDSVDNLLESYDAAGLAVAHSIALQHSFLEELALDTARAQDNDTRRSLQARSSRRFQAWSPKGRRIHNLASEDPDGAPYPSQDRAAEALREFWAPRLSTANGISDDAAGFFLDYVSPTSIIAEPMSLAEFASVLAVSPNSAPGPDGLYFSCWSCAGPDVGRRPYLALLPSLPGRRGLASLFFQCGGDGIHSETFTLQWSLSTSRRQSWGTTSGSQQHLPLE